MMPRKKTRKRKTDARDIPRRGETRLIPVRKRKKEAGKRACGGIYLARDTGGKLGSRHLRGSARILEGEKKTKRQGGNVLYHFVGGDKGIGKEPATTMN